MAGSELAGYASGEDASGMIGGDDGKWFSVQISTGKRLEDAFFECLSGVSRVISPGIAQTDCPQYQLDSPPRS